MRTFGESVSQAQAISGDVTTETLLQLKRDINQGAVNFNSGLGRYFTRKSKVTDLVEEQQSYQFPPDCIRVTGIVTSQSNNRRYPAYQIRSEAEWRAYNTNTQTSNLASSFFVRGSDEILLWPIPSQTVVGGLEMYYETRDKYLSQDDYSTGTLTLTNGSTVVTGLGTSFTQSMVGSILKITDGSDGFWYRVSSVTSATILGIEEPFVGVSGNTVPYVIGESFVFPEDYHDAPVDYAMSRFFEIRNNPERAAYHLSRFSNALNDAKGRYSSSSTSAVMTEGGRYINWFLVPPEPLAG